MISQLISFCILAFIFITGKSMIRVDPFRASRSIFDYVEIFRVGLPTVFRQSLGSVATTLLNVAVRPYGDAAMAAVSIVNRIYILLRSMLIGIGQGFQPVAGYNFGAKKYKRVRQSFNVAILFGTIYGVTASLIFFFFAERIVGLFRADDAQVIAIGAQMMRYLCFSLIVLGYSTYVNQLYQSLGFVVPATLLASCRQGIFFVPLILILPRVLGLTGILVTQASADIITFAVSVPFHIAMLKKHLRIDSTE